MLVNGRLIVERYLERYRSRADIGAARRQFDAWFAEAKDANWRTPAQLYAAVCPASGQAEGLITPQLNTATTNVFLEQLSRQLAPDVHAVLIWDGAGFHRSGELKVPDNITLLPLPPYSPELNPVENLWHYLRSHYWSNREHKDYDALCETVCSSWQDVCLDEERIKTVCHVGYLEKAQ